MCAEEALGERPFLRELAGVFEEGMHPGDAAFGVLVLDAVAGFGVVFHDFACADAALGVDLVEDDVAFAGDADAVFVDEAFEDDGVEEGGEETGEVRRAVRSEGLGHDVLGERVRKNGIFPDKRDSSRASVSQYSVSLRRYFRLPKFVKYSFSSEGMASGDVLPMAFLLQS